MTHLGAELIKKQSQKNSREYWRRSRSKTCRKKTQAWQLITNTQQSFRLVCLTEYYFTLRQACMCVHAYRCSAERKSELFPRETGQTSSSCSLILKHVLKCGQQHLSLFLLWDSTKKKNNNKPQIKHSVTPQLHDGTNLRQFGSPVLRWTQLKGECRSLCHSKPFMVNLSL